LSGDKDMFRYTNPDGQLNIFSDFTMKGKSVHLQRPRYTDCTSSARSIIIPPPRTTDLDPSFVLLPVELLYIRGSPSPLTRYYGNLHAVVKPLRQALYDKLALTSPVKEEYPIWDEVSQKVEWVSELVFPDPKLAHLLRAENALEAFNRFFPNKYLRVGSAEHDEASWHNHIYAMWTTLFELVSAGSGVPMIDMLNNCTEFENSLPRVTTIKKIEKGTMRVCSDCKNTFLFSDKDSAYFLEKGYSPPKRCKSCIEANKLAQSMQHMSFRRK